MYANRFESQVSLGTRDITRSGAHGEFAMAGRSSDHANAPVDTGLHRPVGDISDGVLIADIARDAFTNRHDLVELRWEEDRIRFG